ncbi:MULTISPECIES: hypothetical protein [Burkholderia]|jgi:hypothetical protein|uniref:hypothetical protein n=1 Tax=Burkholderia TaxID=32008 RepID=UPI001B934138|nr:hypothetical protein [Burkholderia multivorans]MBR8047117.1 hypothetical protein [Burkholderia multivorans]MCA8223655.1 hypothetical protein [Burkholderia multivorans]
MNVAVRIDPKAWHAGFDAGEVGHAMTPCPANLDAFSYFSGWIEGDAERQGYEYSAGAER